MRLYKAELREFEFKLYGSDVSTEIGTFISGTASEDYEEIVAYWLQHKDSHTYVNIIGTELT